MLDWLTQAAQDMFATVTGYGFVYSPLYLLTSLAIAMVYWLMAKPGKGMLAYIFPKEVYGHSSHMTDLGVATFNIVFIALGGLSFLFVTPLIAGSVVAWASDPAALSQSSDLTLGWGIALIILLVLTEDLARYIVHRAHHVSPVLWPFHAVHHSAEVLTPTTFFRAHPVYYIPQQLLISLLTGLSQGLIVVIAFGTIPGWVFFAAVMSSRTYMLFGVHLRHSHIPISFGRAIEHVVISPRLHQIHHSAERRHFDQNFGEIFSLWDWMFGTLYIPEKGEKVHFGLKDESGEIFQPYPNTATALTKPFLESAQALRAREKSPSESEIERA